MQRSRLALICVVPKSCHRAPKLAGDRVRTTPSLCASVSPSNGGGGLRDSGCFSQLSESPTVFHLLEMDADISLNIQTLHDTTVGRKKY